jgi:hypothetical protein
MQFEVIHLKDKKYFTCMRVTLILLLLLFACSTILDDTSRKQLLKEGGPVEVASAVLYLVCVAYALLKGGFVFFKERPYFIVIPLVFALRELDFDKRFTTVGLLKSKFVFSPLVPLHEKLIGIPILALIALMLMLMLMLMLKRHLRECWDELKKGSVAGVGVALVISLIVVSKTFDGLERKCTSFGLTVSPLIAKYSSVVEEILELGIPVIMLLLFNHYFSHRNHS